MSTTEWLIVLGALGAIVLVNWYFLFAGRTTATAAAPAVSGAALEAVIVVDGGYSPNTIRAKAGRPLRLIFDRRDDSSCSEEVVIPAFGIRSYLPTGERTAIEVTPTAAGPIPFTCGMGMLKGTILVDA